MQSFLRLAFYPVNIYSVFERQVSKCPRCPVLTQRPDSHWCLHLALESQARFKHKYRLPLKPCLYLSSISDLFFHAILTVLGKSACFVGILFSKTKIIAGFTNSCKEGRKMIQRNNKYGWIKTLESWDTRSISGWMLVWTTGQFLSSHPFSRSFLLWAAIPIPCLDCNGGKCVAGLSRICVISS